MLSVYIHPASLNVRHSPAALHALSWGDSTDAGFVDAGRKHYSAKTDRKIAGILGNLGSDWYKYDFDLLMMYQPAPSVDDPTKMAIYESFAKYTAERRTIGKPAKMLRKMIPAITESMANDFAVWWTETFAVETASYSITESTDEADFVAAYAGEQSKTFDPTLGNAHFVFGAKSLAGSCMRHSFDNLPIHPAAAYASGDFKIVTAKDSAGLIAGRCVVSIARNSIPRNQHLAAAIYTTSDHVSQLMADHLTGLGCIPESSWAGSYLVKIPHDNGFILPYVDGLRTLSDCDESFVFDKYGDIEASCTSGIVYIPTGTNCEDCGDTFNSDESGHYLDGHGYLCDCCLRNEYFFCDVNSEYYPNDERETVYYYLRSGRINSNFVSREAARHSGNYVYCECDGQYWAADDVVYVESADEYYPSQSDDIFVSAVDLEVYLVSDMVTHNDMTMTTDQQTAILEAEQQTDSDNTATTDVAMTDFDIALSKLENTLANITAELELI